MNKIEPVTATDPDGEPVLQRGPTETPEAISTDAPLPNGHLVSRAPDVTFDRALRASAARLTQGMSPNAAAAAWADYFVHLSRAPGRQAQIALHAQKSWFRLLRLASGFGGEAWLQRPDDHRFHHAGWTRPPFHSWQQGFLAALDMWGEATREVARHCR